MPGRGEGSGRISIRPGALRGFTEVRGELVLCNWGFESDGVPGHGRIEW